MFDPEYDAEEAFYQMMRDQMDEHDMRFAPAATQSEAHAEWHRNAGVPMGEPGCPQDACHPPEPDRVPVTTSGVRCGNRDADHRGDWMYHASVADVRECYAESGRFVA